MIALAYVAVVVAARWEHRGRAVHDFVSGVVVLGPAKPHKAPRVAAPPPKPISRWFLLGLVPGLPFGLGMAILATADLVEGGQLGPAMVGMAIGSGALYGCYEVLRRTVMWSRGPWGLPVPTALTRQPRRISRWFLLVMPPVLVLFLLFAGALVLSLAEREPGGTTVLLVTLLGMAYGMWELTRRTLQLPWWAGGGRV
jgi:hypothetical protein